MLLELESVGCFRVFFTESFVLKLSSILYLVYFSRSLFRSEASVFVMLHIQGVIGHWRLL